MLEISTTKAHFNGEMINAVNARDLHKWLESKQDFSTWVKKRIKQCGFEENYDFVRLHKKMEANNATMIEYLISFDMAKHLSMLEKTSNGHLIRKYFIEQEKIARKLNSELMAQFNQAVIEFEKFSDLARQAGRTLCLVGKKLKPQALDKVESLKAQMQPDIFID